MVASHGVSTVIAFAVSLVLVASLQVFKTTLASTQLLTIVGGYLASLVFVFLLTAVSNLEMNLFGENFQSKLFEVIACLVVACGAASIVHRVSITVCVIFSLIALNYLTKISNKHQSAGAAAAPVVGGKKRR